MVACLSSGLAHGGSRNTQQLIRTDLVAAGLGTSVVTPSMLRMTMNGVVYGELRRPEPRCPADCNALAQRT